MIASLLEFSLRQRILVLGLAGVLAVAGVYAFQVIPIDAYPDVTNIQVQVLTEAPGLSPVEVERFILSPSLPSRRSRSSSTTTWMSISPASL
jgi:cobalt-zinc-cadmium resistance protein CzcA